MESFLIININGSFTFISDSKLT
eukprot:SAG11_NODE_3395_length_2473_cov_1.835720_5_plen_22_part_01